MTIGSRRVRLEFFSLSTTRVVNHSRFLRTTGMGASTSGSFLRKKSNCKLATAHAIESDDHLDWVVQLLYTNFEERFNERKPILALGDYSKMRRVNQIRDGLRRIPNSLMVFPPEPSFRGVEPGVFITPIWTGDYEAADQTPRGDDAR
jgi:hypothetical protein